MVTAFYSIKSKFPPEKYFEWANTFMKINAPIILFTEQEFVTRFTTMRGNRPIHIIPIAFEELETWKLHEQKWKRQHMIDPEHGRHSPELYAIWAQKPLFVKRAIQENPFYSSYFFWCDIGAFRDPHINARILETFPQTCYFLEDKILLQSIDNLQETEKLVKDDGIYGPILDYQWNECRLVGGLWGGSIHACLQWARHYQATLERYFEIGRFAGKDQAVMLSTYLENPDLAIVVKPTRFDIDIWFFLQYLLSDTNTPYQINPTYSIQQP